MAKSLVPTDPRPRSKSYSTLSTAEKWEFHADVYAFRRVYLGIHDRTSPCDPEGKWYDPLLIAPIEHRKRAEQDQRKEPGPGDREAWARSLGWSSWLEREDAIANVKRRQEAGLAWQQEHAAELSAMRPIARVVRGITRRVRPSDEPSPPPEEDRRERRPPADMLHEAEENTLP